MYYSFFNQVTMSDRTSSDKMTGDSPVTSLWQSFMPIAPSYTSSATISVPSALQGVYRGGK